MEPKPTWTDKQRIEFTKQIEHLFEIGHPNWHKVLTFAFFRGIATGLGVFIGGTIVVGLLLWILTGLGHIPFLNEVTDSVKNTLGQGNN